MLNLYFDDPFPCINIPEYKDKPSFDSVITTEFRILQCYFRNHNNGPAINAINNIYKFHIDRSAFISCYSNDNGGAVRLDMSDGSLAYVSRTCARDCQCGADVEGNFLRIVVGANLGKCVVSMVSVDQCQKDDMDSYHSFILRNGIQKITNINNTNCKCLRNSGFSNTEAIFCSADYCNFVGNVMKETLLLWASTRSFYKYFNIIKNKCSSLHSFYIALICNFDYSGFPYLSMESSYILDNSCSFLFQNTGAAILSGCFIDTIVTTGNPVSITNKVNTGSYRMTLLESCDLHADIPYLSLPTEIRTKTTILVVLFPLFKS